MAIESNYYASETKKVLKIILVLNILVLAMKFIAGFLTKSLGIIGDAIHSTTDSMNNIVGLAVLKYSNEPPDEGHPYGHGKFETVAAFAIVAFLAVACIELLKSAIGRLIHPVELPLFKIEIIFMLIVTLVINIFVWMYERKKGKNLNSALLLADSSHTGSDVLVTITVLASQIFVFYKLYFMDACVAIVIAFIIGKAAYEIILSTLPILVDEVWIESNEIKKTVLSVDGVVDCYEIFSRKNPNTAFIECKIKVIPKDLIGAHEVSDRVEEKLISTFGECKIMIHIEP